MTYAKQTWTPNVTPVDAAHMQHIEDGIFAVDTKPSASLTYVGAYDPAHTYNDGDYVIGPDGITYVCVIGGTVGVTPTPWATYPVESYGTSLPASPVDGQTAVLVDSLSAPTWQWRFRYNAGSSSTYKWECIGGAAYHGVPGGLGALTTTTLTDLGGSTFTIPRSGVYRTLHGASLYNNGIFNGAYATQLFVCTGATAVGNNAELRHHAIIYAGGAVSTSNEITFASGNVLGLRAMLDRTVAAGGQSTINTPWFDVYPVRVS